MRYTVKKEAMPPEEFTQLRIEFDNGEAVSLHPSEIESVGLAIADRLRLTDYRGIWPSIEKGTIQISLSPTRRAPKPDLYAASKASRAERIKDRLAQGGIVTIILYGDGYWRFHCHGRYADETIEFIGIGEPFDSDECYIDLPGWLTKGKPTILHLIFGDEERTFKCYEIESFHLKTLPVLSRGPFGYGVVAESLDAKLITDEEKEEEIDEDYNPTAWALAEAFFQIMKEGKDIPVMYGMLDWKFPLYFDNNAPGFIRHKKNPPFREWTIRTRSKTGNGN